MSMNFLKKKDVTLFSQIPYNLSCPESSCKALSRARCQKNTSTIPGAHHQTLPRREKKRVNVRDSAFRPKSWNFPKRGGSWAVSMKMIWFSGKLYISFKSFDLFSKFLIRNLDLGYDIFQSLSFSLNFMDRWLFYEFLEDEERFKKKNGKDQAQSGYQSRF